MCSKLCRNFRSEVGDLIQFEPSDEDDVIFWQGNQERRLSCAEMVKEIASFQKEFRELRDTHEEAIQKHEKQFRRKYAQINTDVDKKKDEENLLELLRYLEMKYCHSSDEAGDCEIPLLDESIVRKGHKIIADGVLDPKPSEFSKLQRATTYKGKTYFYQEPTDMTVATSLILDRFNSLYTESCHIKDPVDQLNSLFKTMAWFLFEILDLHPFSDGNGRIFRVLCSYFLTPVTPFYSPIYLYHCTTDDNNDHSICQKPCKDVYEQALWDTHEIQDSESRKPRKILSLIIFSNWKTWRDFLTEIRQCQ